VRQSGTRIIGTPLDVDLLVVDETPMLDLILCLPWTRQAAASRKVESLTGTGPIARSFSY
jgi:hypothetical protein